MKLVYAVIEKMDPKRSTARHLDDGNGWQPFFWAPEESEPTCKICMDLVMMRPGATELAAHNE